MLHCSAAALSPSDFHYSLSVEGGGEGVCGLWAVSGWCLRDPVLSGGDSIKTS